ncbi:hypothetical protein BH10PAT2_BH10PAT2_0390 [soil metagenome]
MSKTTPTPKENETHTHADGTVHDGAAHDTPASPLIAPNSSLTVTLPWDKIQVAYGKLLTRAALNIKTDGFRKGKVPAKLAESMVDQNKLYDQAVQEVFPEYYLEEIKKFDKKPISQPDVEPIETEPNKDWKFTVYFAERPEIKLKEYQKVIDSAHKSAEKEIAEKNAELAKPVEKEDKAVAKDVAPAPVKTEPKELTDAQKEDIKLKHIFRDLAESVKPQIPELLVRQEVNHELEHLVEQLQQLNIKVEDYLQSRQVTAEQLQQEYAGMAVSSLQIEFIIAEIAKDQKMTIKESEIDKTLDTIGDGKMTEADRKNPDTRSYVFSSLLKQKVISKLLNK